MNHFENIIKIGIVTVIVFIPLFILSPFVDHKFKTLDEDINQNKTRFQIMMQVMTHLVVLVILSYVVFRLFEHVIEKYMKIKINKYVHDGYEMVGAVVLVGLQRNLIEKLDYITSTHKSREQ